MSMNGRNNYFELERTDVSTVPCPPLLESSELDFFAPCLSLSVLSVCEKWGFGFSKVKRIVNSTENKYIFNFCSVPEITRRLSTASMLLSMSVGSGISLYLFFNSDDDALQMSSFGSVRVSKSHCVTAHAIALLLEVLPFSIRWEPFLLIGFATGDIALLRLNATPMYISTIFYATTSTASEGTAVPKPPSEATDSDAHDGVTAIAELRGASFFSDCPPEASQLRHQGFLPSYFCIASAGGMITLFEVTPHRLSQMLHVSLPFFEPYTTAGMITSVDLLSCFQRVQYRNPRNLSTTEESYQGYVNRVTFANPKSSLLACGTTNGVIFVAEIQFLRKAPLFNVEMKNCSEGIQHGIAGGIRCVWWVGKDCPDDPFFSLLVAAEDDAIHLLCVSSPKKFSSQKMQCLSVRRIHTFSFVHHSWVLAIASAPSPWEEEAGRVEVAVAVSMDQVISYWRLQDIPSYDETGKPAPQSILNTSHSMGKENLKKPIARVVLAGQKSSLFIAILDVKGSMYVAKLQPRKRS